MMDKAPVLGSILFNHGFCGIYFGETDSYKRLVLYELLKLVNKVSASSARDLHCVECFCGVAAIVRAFQAAGLNAVGMDVALDPDYMDLCTSEGMVMAVSLCMKLSPDALAWFATVCSSWIWICRDKTRRRANRVEDAAWPDAASAAAPVRRPGGLKEDSAQDVIIGD